MSPDHLALEHVRTPRLVLQRMRAEDHADLCRMHRDPRLMATMGGVRPDAETTLYLEKELAHWDAHGFGRWIAREAVGDRFVGRGGLHHLEVGGHAELDLGYALLPEAWGLGYATEIARASAHAAFAVLGRRDVIAITLHRNAASRRVMEKAGFRYERDVEHRGFPHVLYRLTAEEWRRREAPGPP